jgi:hypothetical protein
VPTLSSGIVGIVTRQRTRCPAHRGSILGREGGFSLLQNIKTNCRVQPASCLMRSGGSFFGNKEAGIRSWRLSPLRAETEECVELCLHFVICLKGVQGVSFCLLHTRIRLILEMKCNVSVSHFSVIHSFLV